jgi:hypothetical protein
MLEVNSLSDQSVLLLREALFAIDLKNDVPLQPLVDRVSRLVLSEIFAHKDLPEHALISGVGLEYLTILLAIARVQAEKLDEYRKND